MATYPQPSAEVLAALRGGLVIPAHPLALTDARKLDERRQRALTRYYHAAGAGGIAVGVHTTQFEIRQPAYGLFQPVLELASETIAACDAKTGQVTVRIAGICGRTPQAVAEATLARSLGYHAGLLSLAALGEASDGDLLQHCRAVAEVLSLFGFYLQPAVGGRPLSRQFWRAFAMIPNVIGIKIAPFNRYQTLDVLRGVAESSRADKIALYTGNDDQIVLDLLTPFYIATPKGLEWLRIVGGLMGQWACWTRKAVELLPRCHMATRKAETPTPMLILAAQLTDSNAAIFDAANGFAGCIPGIHEVLRRQGLLANRLCLNPDEELSPGQAEEIDRVYRHYPHLNDDAFVAEHLHEWFA